MQPHVPAVSVDQVSDASVVLDVREPEEWDAGHAPGAMHIPMRDIPARMGEVPMDEDVVVVCRGGGRSAQVVAYLMANGWDNVRNLDGGMLAWARSGRPVVKDGAGEPQIL